MIINPSSYTKTKANPYAIKVLRSIWDSCSLQQKKKKKILCSAGLKAEIEPPKLDFNKFVGHGAQTHLLPVKQPKGE